MGITRTIPADESPRWLKRLFHGTWRTDGWRLAPAYDLNAVPTDIKPRVLTTASRERALDVADYFEIDAGTANTIAAEVGQAVVMWRAVGAELGLSLSKIDRMASAFEHQDLQASLNPRPRARKTRR